MLKSLKLTGQGDQTSRFSANFQKRAYFSSQKQNFLLADLLADFDFSSRFSRKRADFENFPKKLAEMSIFLRKKSDIPEFSQFLKIVKSRHFLRFLDNLCYTSRFLSKKADFQAAGADFREKNLVTL